MIQQKMIDSLLTHVFSSPGNLLIISLLFLSILIFLFVLLLIIINWWTQTDFMKKVLELNSKNGPSKVCIKLFEITIEPHDVIGKAKETFLGVFLELEKRICELERDFEATRTKNRE